MARVMFDSVDATMFPDPTKVPFDVTAGYVNGRWPSSSAIKARFPNLPHLSISVTSTGVADCCDVENSDLTADQVPAWVDNYWNRRLARPVVYCGNGDIAAVRTAMGSRPFWWWSAHWKVPRVAFIDPGADATQWNDTGPNGEGVDQTLMSDAFYAAISGDNMALTQADVDLILDAPITRQPGNDPKSTTSLRSVLAYFDAVEGGSLDRILAAIKALPPELTPGQVADELRNRLTS